MRYRVRIVRAEQVSLCRALTASAQWRHLVIRRSHCRVSSLFVTAGSGSGHAVSVGSRGAEEMDWSKLPDFGAIALLTCAFASVAKRRHTHQSILWLVAWLMITLHFAALIFGASEGFAGKLATFVALAALTWAGVMFIWAAVPYHENPSSPWMLAALLGANTAYIGSLVFVPGRAGILFAAANLYWVLPTAVAVVWVYRFRHWLRWFTVGLNAALAGFLLTLSSRVANRIDPALNAVLFAVYLGCCVHYWYAYRRRTTGAFITVAGFAAWAAVFVIAPTLQAVQPRVHVESELWNVPKYLVAIGMILLFLEDQIAHNQHLALHDELTGLPNRRLFQDRLQMLLAHARRTDEHVALLLLDLDGFKDVNDTLGHHAGDLLLRHVGQVLSERLRKSDTIARTGGDEFSILLAGIDRKSVIPVCLTLQAILKQPIELEGHTISAPASIGVAVYPEDAIDAQALCIAADKEMYAVKQSSRQLTLSGGEQQCPEDCRA